MRIKTQEEILDPGIRKKIIEEIECSENKDRKHKSFKRHMIYKDQVEYWVLEMLERQFDQNTVKEMAYAISNISFLKKIIDKLARVYSQGAIRTVVDDAGVLSEEDTAKVQKLSKILNINSKQKSVNRYLKLHSNDAMYIKPCPNEYGQWSVVPTVLAPHLYDVVEDYYDRTKGLVYILSAYEPQTIQYTSQDVSKEGRSFDTSIRPKIGNGKDEIIADSPEDSDVEKKQYIWWSDNYHFTTDYQGNIVSEGTENPIGKSPIIPYAKDQDNNFWAQGGDDLEQQSVRLNAQMSHINYIGALQGYGTFYYKGKKAPSNLAIGPSKGIKLEYEKDDPIPEIGFAQSSPQLTALMQMVEAQLALLLTTNNLSTAGVSTSMGTPSGFTSALHAMVDKSESMEDVQDQQQIFLDNEPKMWDVINKWLMLYEQEGTLVEELQGLTIPEDMTVNVQFLQPTPIVSEGEKLANIKLRKELGINTMEDLIKIDQPNLTDEEAHEKLEQIQEQKVLKVKTAAGVMDEGEGNEDNIEDNVDESRPVQ